MLKKFVLGGMVVVAALLGNACGDDGSSDSPAGPADSEVTLSSSSDDVVSSSSEKNEAISSSRSTSSSSEKAVDGSSSSDGKTSSSSGKVESSSSGKGEKSSSSEGAAGSSSSDVVAESSSSEKSSSSVAESSSSVESSSSEVPSSSSVVESSSIVAESSSSSMKPKESSSSEESSSSMKQSSSSVVVSSSSVESVAEIKPNGYYKSNCPEGKKCNYVSTDYLNQKFLLDNKYGEIRDDRDGKIYKTIKIGEQIWMAQNLNYTTNKSWCFENESSNCDKYGRLYTWAGAIDSLRLYRLAEIHCGYNRTCSFLSETKWRGVCPLGWHLPTKAEFDTLVIKVLWRSSALKSNTSWIDENGNDCSGDDSFGFSAMPAGWRFYLNNAFDQLGQQAYIWSVSEYEYPYNKNSAYHLFLSAVNDEVAVGNTTKSDASSVRCIKDSE